MNYRYKSEKIDNWGFMTPDANGIMYGDCDSWCLTYLLKHCKGSLILFWLSLLAGYAQIMWCEINSNQHVILRIGFNLYDCNSSPLTRDFWIDHNYSLNLLSFIWGLPCLNAGLVMMKMLRSKLRY